MKGPRPLQWSTWNTQAAMWHDDSTGQPFVKIPAVGWSLSRFHVMKLRDWCDRWLAAYDARKGER